MQRHLSTLSILHYVYGAFICLTGLGLVLVVGVGGLLSSDLVQHGDGDAPPEWIGRLLQGFGMILFVLVESWGLLNMLSGYWIAKRRNRTGTQVIAALNCLNMPLGLALGIFTFIALGDDAVKHEYDQRKPGIR
ncbi:MAG: hypothetical protein R2817_14680 [Flavobacteriales bacterium]